MVKNIVTARKDLVCPIVTFKNGTEVEACSTSSKYALSVVGNFMKVELVELDFFDILSFKKILKYNSNEVVVLLLTHGGWGENGMLQMMLANYGFTYTHSDYYACSNLSNKHIAKLNYLALKIPTPSWIYNSTYFGDTPKLEKADGYVKKPLYGGSKTGIVRVRTANDDTRHLYENYVGGRLEVSTYVLGAGGKSIVLPLIVRLRNIGEIGRLSKPLSSYDIKDELIEKIRNYTKTIHNTLGCKGITKTDYLIDNNQNAYAIETDLIPGMSENSGVVFAAKQLNMEPELLFKKLLSSAEN